MKNIEELLKFKNIELKDYINKRHPKEDLVDIDAEKSRLKCLMKNIDESSSKYFFQKQDALLKLLEVYQKCYEIIEELKNKMQQKKDEKEEIPIYSTELQRKFELFEENMAIFLSERRYFVTSAIFEEGNILCILTNDLLFIGEKSDVKFKLKRSVSKEVINMEMQDHTLCVKFEGSSYSFKGEKKDVENLFYSFQEISYNFADNAEEDAVDTDLVDYYVETRRYDALINYLSQFKNPNIKKKIFNNIHVFDGTSFTELTDEDFFRKFSFQRFKMGLSKVNRIQKLERYISSVFSYIESFTIEFKEQSMIMNMPNRRFILILEDFIKYTLEVIEPRIVNHYRICGKDLRGLIEERLEFHDLNFKYLIKKMATKKSVNATMLEQAKIKIKENVMKMLK